MKQPTSTRRWRRPSARWLPSSAWPPRGLESLNPRLRQVARLRLEYPEASLEELGQAANPPLSKSAVNYRLRRLMELAGKDLTPREIYSIMAKKHEGEKLWQKEK